MSQGKFSPELKACRAFNLPLCPKLEQKSFLLTIKADYKRLASIKFLGAFTQRVFTRKTLTPESNGLN